MCGLRRNAPRASKSLSPHSTAVGGMRRRIETLRTSFKKSWLVNRQRRPNLLGMSLNNGYIKAVVLLLIVFTSGVASAVPNAPSSAVWTSGERSLGPGLETRELATHHTEVVARDCPHSTSPPRGDGSAALLGDGDVGDCGVVCCPQILGEIRLNYSGLAKTADRHQSDDDVLSAARLPASPYKPPRTD